MTRDTKSVREGIDDGAEGIAEDASECLPETRLGAVKRVILAPIED